MSAPADLRHSPAAERNRGPIGEALQALLPAQGKALEIACGTGQHAAWFGAQLPGWQWQPTDAVDETFPSVRHWCAGQANVRAPEVLDLLALPPAGSPLRVPARLGLVFCANMLHISPWATCAALMQLAAETLQTDGQLIVYGPFVIDGEPLAPSNAAFDADLRARHPAWGLRTLADVEATAVAHGLVLAGRTAMPANNQLLVWRHRGRA